MKLLKERIQKDGVVKEGNVLKVDRFLNHQMDVKLFREIGKEFRKRFEGEEINKILTIEASGIGVLELPVLQQRFLTFLLSLQKKRRQKILQEMCIQRKWNLSPMEESMTLLYPKSFWEKEIRYF